MLIKKISLKQFGGHNHTVEFKTGLNVLYGPNDIGKSSLIQAVEFVLFMSAKPKGKEKEILKKFIPLNGDSMEVQLTFVAGEIDYTLKKIWGGKLPDATMTSGAGLHISSEEEINSTLRQLLPQPEATMKTILMAHQSQLKIAIEQKEFESSEQNLTTILRQACLDSGGVSLESLKKRLDLEINKSFDYWDDSAQAPLNHRSIDNPWKRGGIIVNSFYYRERLKRAHQKALDAESRIDNLSGQLAEAKQQEFDAKEFRNKCKPVVESLVTRENLQIRLRQSEVHYLKLREDLAEWSDASVKVLTTNENLHELEIKIEILKKELQQASSRLNDKIFQLRFQKIMTEKAQMDKATIHLQSLKKVSNQDLQKLVEADQNIQKAVVSRTAGQISLNLTAKRPLTAKIRQDLEPERSLDLSISQSVDFCSNGLFNLETNEVIIEIYSGEGDLKKQKQKALEAQELLSGLLDSMKVANLDEAQRLYAEYSQAFQKVERLRYSYEQLLAGETFAEIEHKNQVISNRGPTRELNEIQEDLARAEGKKSLYLDQKQRLQTRLNELAQKYTNQDMLIHQIGDCVAEKKSLAAAIENLPAISEEFGNSTQLLERFRQCESDLETLRGKIIYLHEQIASVDTPDESSQELANRLEQAERNFDTRLKHGSALKRIKQAVEETEQEFAQKNHFEEYKLNLENYVRRLTGERYVEVKLSSAKPEQIIRAHDHISVPFVSLSTGMKDALSIGLRLTMASYFLQNQKGFFLLDDPLVDLDQSRQSLACEALLEFAQKHQIIITTCHRWCADKLGGNIISLT